MNNYISKTININDDIWLEIHFNPSIHNRPYLLKTFGWDGCGEYRMSQKDLLNFSDSLSDFVFDKDHSTGYDDDCETSQD